MRTITYEKPHQMKWNDKNAEKLIKLKEGGMLDRKIAEIFNCSWEAIRTELTLLRNNPKYAGTVPYFKEVSETVKNTNKRVGIIDIEFWSTNFAANRGFILSYCIKEYKKNKYYSMLINPNDIRKGTYDKAIVTQLVKDILKFDVLVGYYSSGCDIPFIRTRAMKMGIAFPFYNTIQQFDLYYAVKFKLKLNRNSLDSACKTFGIGGKTHIDFSLWEKFIFEGDKKAGQNILAHNTADVRITERLYTKMLPFIKGSLKSI